MLSPPPPETTVDEDTHTSTRTLVKKGSEGAMHTRDVMLSESLNSMTHRLVQAVSTCYSVWTTIPRLRPQWSFLKVVCCVCVCVCVCTCQNKDCTQNKVKRPFQTAIHKTQTDDWSANLSGDGWRAQIGACVNAFFSFFFLSPENGNKSGNRPRIFHFLSSRANPPFISSFHHPLIAWLLSPRLDSSWRHLACLN